MELVAAPALEEREGGGVPFSPGARGRPLPPDTHMPPALGERPGVSLG